jgi:glucose/arabinose dehydrogenase/mono/diheme cytochrome c family protein
MKFFKCLFILIVFTVNTPLVAQLSGENFESEKALFEQNCSSCHTFDKPTIGPALGGLKGKVTEKWMLDFISNPKKIIDRKDPRAQAQFKKFNVYMPSYTHLGKEEIQGLVQYIFSQNPVNKSKISGLKAILDPIPAKIPTSNLALDLKYINTVPASGAEILRTRIAKMAPHPITKENMIMDLRGFLYKIDEKEVSRFFNLAEKFPNFMSEPGFATGFGSFAFHPDFVNNGILYTTHSEFGGSKPADFAYNDSIKVKLQWVVNEWKTNSPEAFPFAVTAGPRELFRINMVKQIHGMQEIAFNPNPKPGTEDYGLLYIGIGDGGCVEDGFPEITHNIKKPWGSVFRIDPLGKNSKNGQYGIPESNPYVKNGLGEVYANGFRNPHRISWTKTGQMIVSNIGQKMIESLNLVEKGGDFGWPIREGRFLQIPGTDLSKVYAMPKVKTNITFPIAEIDHDEIVAICGGYEYLGEKIPELKGKYVFGSVVEGRLFYINLVDVKQNTRSVIKEIKIHKEGKPIKLSEFTKNERVDLRIGRDAKGELYIFTKPDGKVYQLVKP